MVDIEKFLDLTGYDTDIRRSRRKDKETNSQEFFTPYSIIKRMCDKISEEEWSDPVKTFLEPCAGNGQFVCYIIWNRIQHGLTWRQAMNTLYALELMPDNVDEIKSRIKDLFKQMNIIYDNAELDIIMNTHIVCHDFFTWNFEKWRPMTDEELKNKKK